SGATGSKMPPPTPDPSSRLTDHRRCIVLLKFANNTTTDSNKLEILRSIIERKRIVDSTSEASIWPKLVFDIDFDSLDWSTFHCHRRIRLALFIGFSAQNAPAVLSKKDLAVLSDVLTATLPADWSENALESIMNDLTTKLASQLTAELTLETSQLSSPSQSPASTPSTPPAELSSNSSLSSVQSGQAQQQIPMTPIEASTSVGWSEGKRSKRGSSRREKQRADLRLLLGDFKSARSGYKTSIETLRALNDWLWYASALEGLSAVADAEAESTTDELDSTNESETDLEAPEATAARCREAVSEYQKFSAAAWLAAEATLKAARAMRGYQQHWRSRRWPAVEAVQFLELPATERLLDSVGNSSNTWCIGDLMAELGLTRRAVLHRWLAANKHLDDVGASGVDLDSSVALLTRCLDNDREIDDGTSLSAPRLKVTLACRLVALLRQRQNTATTSSSTATNDKAWERALSTLGSLGPWLTPNECNELFDCLSDATNSFSYPIRAPSRLPEWLLAKPESMPDSPVIMTSATSKASSSGEENQGTNVKPLFIYTPLTLDGNADSAKKSAPVYWSIEEPNRLCLTLRHNLPVPLQLNQLSLRVRRRATESASDNSDDDDITESVWPATVTESKCDFIELNPVTSSNSSDSITLLVKPTELGQFDLIGIDYYLMPSSLPLRSDLPSIASVKVVPILPKLRVEWLDGGSVKLAIDPMLLSGHQIDSDRSVAAGSSASMQLRLTNVGNLPISQASLDLMPLGLASWSEGNLVRQLPIAPGDVAAVTLYVGMGSGRQMPDFGRHRLRVRVCYSAGNSVAGAQTAEVNSDDCAKTTLGRAAVLYGHVSVDRIAPGQPTDDAEDDESAVPSTVADDEACEDAVATAEWLAGQLLWKCNCDGGNNNANDKPGLRLLIGQVRSVSVEVRYRGHRLLPGPALLVWPEQAGLLVTGQTATQLPELSRKHRLARLSSGVLLLGNGCASQLMATLFFPSTNVKVTKAWPIQAV
ncbi:hypothetical protein BOX15_Mlig030993g5, partial [Macrostomum lignano]